MESLRKKSVVEFHQQAKRTNETCAKLTNILGDEEEIKKILGTDTERYMKIKLNSILEGWKLALKETGKGFDALTLGEGIKYMHRGFERYFSTHPEDLTFSNDCKARLFSAHPEEFKKVRNLIDFTCREDSPKPPVEESQKPKQK